VADTYAAAAAALAADKLGFVLLLSVAGALTTLLVMYGCGNEAQTLKAAVVGDDSGSNVMVTVEDLQAAVNTIAAKADRVTAMDLLRQEGRL